MADPKPKGEAVGLTWQNLDALSEAIKAADDHGIGSFHWGDLKVKFDHETGVHHLMVQPVD